MDIFDAAILLLLVIVAKIDVLPAIGDIDSAPALHVSKYYIEHSVQDTNSPNMVTAMIVDYRCIRYNVRDDSYVPSWNRGNHDSGG